MTHPRTLPVMSGRLWLGVTGIASLIISLSVLLCSNHPRAFNVDVGFRRLEVGSAVSQRRVIHVSVS